MRIICVLALLGGATGLSAKPGETAVASNPLFRSTGPEVRFRCGSDLMRAKLRGGRLVVRTAQGEKAILSPVTEPRAIPLTPAYSDGRLTLYKVKNPETWALARADRPGDPAQCSPQRRAP